MNRRARNRLIGVTVIILGVAAAVFFAFIGPNAAYSRSVSEVLKDPTLVGKRVKVKGSVVKASWDKRTHPMKFRIADEGKTSGRELSVSYDGGAPNTFGDGIVAIVTGQLGTDGTVKADEMVTVCPSRYAEKSDAITVDELLNKKPGGMPKVYGWLKAGSLKTSGQGAERFILTSLQDGGKELRVKYDGAMPKDSKDGGGLVVLGAYSEQGLISASTVSKLATEK